MIFISAVQAWRDWLTCWLLYHGAFCNNASLNRSCLFITFSLEFVSSEKFNYANIVLFFKRGIQLLFIKLWLLTQNIQIKTQSIGE
jgi:hypothetical protein